MARALHGRARVVLVIASDADIGSADTSGFADVKRLPIRPMRRSFKAALVYVPCLLLASLRLSRAMRQDAAQVLIVNDFYLMQAPVCRLLGFRGKVLTWVRIRPDTFGFISHVWLWAARKTSDEIIAVSRYIQGLLPKEIATALIYDAVDPRFEAEVPDVSPSKRTFVFIGNYVAGKGQDLAIEAMARVLDTFPDARMEFYGGTLGLQKNRAFRDALEERAIVLGIVGNIHFGDFVMDPREVLLNKLAAVNLSNSESFSMTVLEASACALPVVATRSGGPQEIIEDGRTGYLVPQGDIDACAAAMCRLCMDPVAARRMGLAGRARVLSEFSYGVFRNRLGTLLDLAL